ncbi:UNVERIFIED_CONTAM: hypothetical protein Sradi_4377200 [Sesamum radiatum]|uniref:Transposase MuDR plant domain-containing protein n=1 Tax=Sesamum radiatum TaxID=300843 RepID=A0AAW2NSB4_SESRA
MRIYIDIEENTNAEEDQISEKEDLVDSDYELGDGQNEMENEIQNEMQNEIQNEQAKTGARNCVEGDNESSEEEEDDVVETEVDFDEHRDSDGEGDGYTYTVFNPEVVHDPVFELGMMFSNKKEFKMALHSHAIKTRRTLKFVKNDKIRVYAQCRDPECEWKLHAVKLKDEETSK